MAGIVAHFDADWTGFNQATAAADAALKGVDVSSAKVGTSLRLVSSESQRAAPHVDDLRGAMGKFDGVLSSVGIRMGPEIRALGELGDAAGKTSTQMGLLGTAGLVLGAAIGGWKIGRAVADFTGLDAIVASSAAKLFGWGDNAAQVAGSKADVLAAASLRAGRAITDMAEAVAINAAAQAKMIAASTANAVAADQLTLATKTADDAAVHDAGVRINNAAQLARLKEELVSVKAATDADAQATRDAAAAADEATVATDVWRSSATFTTEVIGQLVPTVEQLAAKVKTLSGEMVDAAAYAANQLRGGDVALGDLSSADFNRLGGDARIKQIEDSYRYTPGRRVGGTGSTGVGMNDAQGYARLLQEQRDYAQLKRYQGGNQVNTNVNINVNGTAQDVARQVAAEIARQIASGMLLPA